MSLPWLRVPVLVAEELFCLWHHHTADSSFYSFAFRAPLLEVRETLDEARKGDNDNAMGFWTSPSLCCLLFLMILSSYLLFMMHLHQQREHPSEYMFPLAVKPTSIDLPLSIRSPFASHSQTTDAVAVIKKRSMTEELEYCGPWMKRLGAHYTQTLDPASSIPMDKRRILVVPSFSGGIGTPTFFIFSSNSPALLPHLGSPQEMPLVCGWLQACLLSLWTEL